ncbi:MAG TPA: c-type cytochrome [Candidatus Acidoferrales bacterium]|nr:c-type cytochrome [Candidatus Acidoferrales bacterium]
MLVPPRQTKSNRILAIGAVVLFATVLFCGALLVRFLAQQSELAQARKLRNPVPASAAALSAGQNVYEHHCQSCHGAAGNGKGDRAQNLSVTPTDFTNAKKMSGIPDGELFWVTTKGHRPMPAFEKKLSDQERWQVVDYIREFARRTAGK